jgi:hypothetical protein
MGYKMIDQNTINLYARVYIVNNFPLDNITDDNMQKSFKNCSLPARIDWYPEIRKTIQKIMIQWYRVGQAIGND